MRICLNCKVNYHTDILIISPHPSPIAFKVDAQLILGKNNILETQENDIVVSKLIPYIRK